MGDEFIILQMLVVINSWINTKAVKTIVSF